MRKMRLSCCGPSFLKQKNRPITDLFSKGIATAVIHRAKDKYTKALNKKMGGKADKRNCTVKHKVIKMIGTRANIPETKLFLHVPSTVSLTMPGNGEGLFMLPPSMQKAT